MGDMTYDDILDAMAKFSDPEPRPKVIVMNANDIALGLGNGWIRIDDDNKLWTTDVCPYMYVNVEVIVA